MLVYAENDIDQVQPATASKCVVREIILLATSCTPDYSRRCHVVYLHIECGMDQVLLLT